MRIRVNIQCLKFEIQTVIKIEFDFSIKLDKLMRNHVFNFQILDEKRNFFMNF